MIYPANSSQARRAARIELLFPLEYPADLPVVLRREELVRAIVQNQVVIVCGETGSGKTTQLPKICLSIGRGVQGVIAHTQPRRVAARSVANRIAQELKTELGGVVGYKVRFNDKVSDVTCIKLMTDGILLAEIQSDPLLRKYDTIIIDEAHERSLNIDFLLGYFRQLLPRRPDLKLIITSATLDAERFARHFSDAPIIQVSGRSYSIETRYRPPQQNEEGEQQDIPQAVCSALDELSIGGLRGDVLVFLPGEREIRDTAEALRKHHPKGVEILPLFSRLSAAEQDRVFKPASGMRRVVLATNVAETSLTVPNIAYVIDSGQARINRYSIRQKVEQLRVEKISRAAANQRAGRCGRVMSGICVRLYDEADFIARAEYTDAEIFRVSLATVILRMSALGLGEVEKFPFIEPPGSRSIADGYQLLAELGAIDEARQLTPLGRELAKLPLDPKIARLLLAGRQYQCLSEILIIASALSLQDPRDRPSERREAADAAHQRFNDERSDFLSYLKIWAWFLDAVKHKKTNRLWANECREKFLSPLRLREWHELHQQLHAQVLEMGWMASITEKNSAVTNPLSPRGRAREGEHAKHHIALPEVMLNHARDLRKNATDAENLLWQLLRRNYLLGFGFRRQHPVGKYILDFYCHQAKLAIELDGGQHADDVQRQHDDVRSTYLQMQGITVLRFWNNEVLTNTEGVLQTLFQWLNLNGGGNPTSPLPNPPPGGEGIKKRPPSEEGGILHSTQPASYEQIHKALLTGLLGNIGCKSVDKEPYYLGAREIKFFIAPNSVLAKKGAKWVVAAELTETTRLYARNVARIEPEWLEEVGAHLIKRSYFDPHWEKKAAQVAAWERSTLYGLVINPKKRVHYGPMNVAESREVFIRQALVTGEFNTLAPFFAHNQKLIHDIEVLEHKARRPDVLVDDELIFAFYDSRVPPHIHNGAAFEAWRKEAEREQPRLLFLKKDDLMRHEAAGITTDQFPPQLLMNNISYALAYHFAPGKSDDGVTLTVPLVLINQVSAPRCEYLVPGLLAEKVTQLVKTLPQKLRRNLVPVPEFSAAFCREVEPSDVPLLQALARYIRAQKQLDVPLDAFRMEQLSVHLQMNFYVVDEHGRQLGVSRNFTQLRTELAPKLEPLPAKVKGAEQTQVRFTDWAFGEFKATSELTRAGQTVTLFNALVDEGDAVALRAFDTRDEAQAAHRKGLVRLFMLALKEQVKFLEKNLPGIQAMGMQFLPFGSQQDLLRQILSVTFDRCCLMEPWPSNEKEFAARCKDAKSRLTLVAQEIARLVGAVLTEYHALQKSLPGFKAHALAVQDIRAQCDWMLGKEWIARTSYERLQHVPRYLKAIAVRLEKLRANPARDVLQLAQMQSLQQAWQRKLVAQQGDIDERVTDFGWLLQELRVSLFAQELKTPVIVSVKRLQKMWETM
jgi:HrpA-like RNA helicase